MLAEDQLMVGSYARAPSEPVSELTNPISWSMKCKHVLAAKLAVRLKRCVERNVTEDGLVETSLVDAA